jgi:hypothetical protein
MEVLAEAARGTEQVTGAPEHRDKETLEVKVMVAAIGQVAEVAVQDLLGIVPLQQLLKLLVEQEFALPLQGNEFFMRVAVVQVVLMLLFLD